MHNHEWGLRSSPGREGAERACLAKIEVPFHSRMDHFPDFLKGIGLYARSHE